jgi:hypothetical protein
MADAFARAKRGKDGPFASERDAVIAEWEYLSDAHE